MSNQFQAEVFGESEFGELDLSMLDVDHFELVGDTSNVNNEMVVIEENLDLGSNMDRFIESVKELDEEKAQVSDMQFFHNSRFVYRSNDVLMSDGSKEISGISKSMKIVEYENQQQGQENIDSFQRRGEPAYSLKVRQRGRGRGKRGQPKRGIRGSRGRGRGLGRGKVNEEKNFELNVGKTNLTRLSSPKELLKKRFPI